MGGTRVPSYLLSAPRTRRPTLCTKLLRTYYDYSYGYREQRAFTLPDCEFPLSTCRTLMAECLGAQREEATTRCSYSLPQTPPPN